MSAKDDQEKRYKVNMVNASISEDILCNGIDLLKDVSVNPKARTGTQIREAVVALLNTKNMQWNDNITESMIRKFYNDYFMSTKHPLNLSAHYLLMTTRKYSDRKLIARKLV